MEGEDGEGDDGEEMALEEGEEGEDMADAEDLDGEGMAQMAKEDEDMTDVEDPSDPKITMEDFDSDKDGKLTWGEFEAATAEDGDLEPESKAGLSKLFQEHDKDGDAALNLDELGSFMSNAGEHEF